MTQIISIAQRHKYILDKLKKDGYIRVADIAKSLKVTAVTVRKDFKALEEQGLLFRTHGSACPVNPHVADRMRTAQRTRKPGAKGENRLRPRRNCSRRTTR